MHSSLSSFPPSKRRRHINFPLQLEDMQAMRPQVPRLPVSSYVPPYYNRGLVFQSVTIDVCALKRALGSNDATLIKQLDLILSLSSSKG